MKTLLLVTLLLCNLSFADETTRKYINYLQHLPTKTKKYRFFKLVLPAVQKVNMQLRVLYLQTKYDIEHNAHQKRLHQLMRTYKARNHLDLLMRIKPHPISITLAQAAIESAWATSRFFVEAKNIFGMWTKDPRYGIKALQVRQTGKQVYLRKYKTYEDSVRHYYKTLATLDAYENFRRSRYYNTDPYEIAGWLDNYSERKENYTVSLIKVIFYNNLTRFDNKLPLPLLEEVPLTQEEH
jgi:Bax protein